MTEPTLTARTTKMNAQRTAVFLDRYALKDSTGAPIEEDPSEMWERVATGIADSDEQAGRFAALLEDFKFVPGGRILAGAGTGTEVTFYNCYVIPIETRARRQARGTTSFESHDYEGDRGADSREAILDTVSVMVDIMSRGGGVGINWSVLRPRGTHLKRVNGTTSGPVAWMDVASHAVQTVTQGGSRRGAAMFMLDDWHPDVLEFIDAKRDLEVINGANVSVAVSDEFMEAVRTNGDWTFRFPATDDPRYDDYWSGDLAGWEADGGQVVDYGTMPAREVWGRMAKAAWHNGEPGVVFLGRYNAESTGQGVERIICVNPCGEQGLGPYSVCNLGSMNLDAYLIKKGSIPTAYTYTFDWHRFMEDAETATEFLDNVVDKNFYFLPQNEQVQKDLRRIGLGVMGLADALIALGIRYGSPAAVNFTDRVFASLKTAAIRRSLRLAIAKGPAPAWDPDETWKRPFFAEYVAEDNPLGRQLIKHGLRNMFLLTQAPTGSTSILAGVNSGIEPYFAFEYTRKDRTGEHKVVASAVEKYRQEGVYAGSEWVTSNDIGVEEHIAMQAAVQRHIDSSVSKTVNGPNEQTVEDVQKLFDLAYDSGLKGVAYFRDGNGRDQVLYKEKPVERETQPDDYLHEAIAELIPYALDYARPDVLSGTTRKVATRAGTAYVTVNRDGDRPIETFFNVGKAGSDLAAMAEALGRLASLALRKGATLGGVANQLNGVGGSTGFNKALPHALAEALSSANGHGEVDGSAYARAPLLEMDADDVKVTLFETCPECQSDSLVREEGCSKCVECGYSAC